MVYNQVTPKRKDDLMNAKLTELLKAAKEACDISNLWFSKFEKYEVSDKEMADMYWSMCKEENSRCNALLEAYAIMSGKIINQWDIEDEIQAIDENV